MKAISGKSVDNQGVGDDIHSFGLDLATGQLCLAGKTFQFFSGESQYTASRGDVVTLTLNLTDGLAIFQVNGDYGILDETASIAIKNFLECKQLDRSGFFPAISFDSESKVKGMDPKDPMLSFSQHKWEIIRSGTNRLRAACE